MKKEDILQKVRAHIAKADLDGALEFMTSIIHEDDELIDELILLQASHVHNEKVHGGNRIELKDYLTTRARIEKAALDSVKKIEPIAPLPIDIPKEYEIPVVKKISKTDIHKIALTAKLLRKAGNYADALKQWQKLSEEQQKRTAFCNEIAMLHRLMNNHDKALILLGNIRNNNPKDVRCLNELATCQRELNWTESALETLKTGLAIEPENGHLYSNQFFIHLFFTLDEERAIATRDSYAAQFGKFLIEKESYRQLCNDFLAQLDAIKTGQAPAELMQKFIDECQGDKRAFLTAKRLKEVFKNE
jgi:tetratricopeptide (TPR) repeat protein